MFKLKIFKKKKQNEVKMEQKVKQKKFKQIIPQPAVIFYATFLTIYEKYFKPI